MKILHTTGIYEPGCHGVSGDVRDLVRGLEAEGHTVHVLAPTSEGSPRENGVIRVKMDKAGDIPGRALTRARKFKPDVIHVHDPVALGLPALKLGEELGVPVVYTLHAQRGVAPSNAARLAFQQASGCLARASSLVVAPSTGARQWVRTHIADGSIEVIPTGVSEDLLSRPPSREEARAERKLDGNLFVVGLAGGPRADGGMESFLDAISRMLAASPSVRLLVTGSDSFRRWVTRRIPKELRKPSVQSEATSSVRELEGFLDALDLFVAPSVNDPEGRNAQRAMARGVPVLAPQPAPWGALLKEGQNGFIAGKGGADDFLGGMEKARRDLRLRRAPISKAAREAVEKRTVARAAERVSRAYETLLRTSRANRIDQKLLDALEAAARKVPRA